MSDNLLAQEEIDALLGKGSKASQPGSEEEFAEDKSEFTEGSASNLELILDFPLKVSVRLGAVSKKLQEIRRFSQGAVVELDRFVNDPVDVFVNGKLIAQGEVVVVEENFGIRITNIIGPVERIKKLK